MRIRYVGIAMAAITLPALVALGHGSMKEPVSRVYSIYLEGPENPKSPSAQAAVAECGTQPFYDWHELVNFIPVDPRTSRTLRTIRSFAMDIWRVATTTSMRVWT